MKYFVFKKLSTCSKVYPCNLKFLKVIGRVVVMIYFSNKIFTEIVIYFSSMVDCCCRYSMYTTCDCGYLSFYPLEKEETEGKLNLGYNFNVIFILLSL